MRRPSAPAERVRAGFVARSPPRMQRLLASMVLAIPLGSGCFADSPTVGGASVGSTGSTDGPGSSPTSSASAESSSTSAPGTGEGSSEVTDATVDTTVDTTDGSTGEPTMCAPAPDGLVAWWSFEGDAIDEVTELPLMLTNAVVVDEGRFGGALGFNGLDAIARANAAAVMDVGDGDFSIETWVYLESLMHPKDSLSALDDYAIVTRMISLGATPNADGWRLLMFGGGSAPRWWFCMGGTDNGCDPDGSTPNVAVSTSAPVAGTWTHLVGVRATGALRLYVDGALEGTADPGAPGQAVNSDRGPLFVGATEFVERVPDAMTYGRVDEVSFYDRALDDAEVAELAAASLPRCR